MVCEIGISVIGFSFWVMLLVLHISVIYKSFFGYVSLCVVVMVSIWFFSFLLFCRHESRVGVGDGHR